MIGKKRHIKENENIHNFLRPMSLLLPKLILDVKDYIYPHICCMSKYINKYRQIAAWNTKIFLKYLDIWFYISKVSRYITRNYHSQVCISYFIHKYLSMYFGSLFLSYFMGLYNI